MNNCMVFPETFDEFVEIFGFVDSKEYYTNGSELIQVFRVKQWLENESARQKAEIKSLTSGKCVYLSDDETTEYCVEGPCPNYKTETQIKAEAIKEFAERLKAECRQDRYSIQTTTKFGVLDKKYLRVVDESDIDNLVKEMEGD